MSHITRIKTQMVEKEYLVKALEDLGYQPEVGDLSVRAGLGEKTGAEIRISGGFLGGGIGFRKSGKTYEIVADWYGNRKVRNVEFMNQIMQRYAYHAAMAKLQDKRFSKVSEEVDEHGRIHIVLRRTA
jgi:hypothetical protein